MSSPAVSPVTALSLAQEAMSHDDTNLLIRALRSHLAGIRTLTDPEGTVPSVYDGEKNNILIRLAINTRSTAALEQLEELIAIVKAGEVLHRPTVAICNTCFKSVVNNIERQKMHDMHKMINLQEERFQFLKDQLAERDIIWRNHLATMEESKARYIRAGHNIEAKFTHILTDAYASLLAKETTIKDLESRIKDLEQKSITNYTLCTHTQAVFDIAPVVPMASLAIGAHSAAEIVPASPRHTL